MAGPPVGFTFTETMGGYVACGAETYRQGGRRVPGAQSLRFRLTITIADLRAFVRDPAHAAVLSGTINSSEMGSGLAVDNGVFNLLERTAEGRLRMGYYVEFRSNDGMPYALEGFKDVHNDRVIDLWYDTTALFTTVRPLEPIDGATESRGILRIRPLDLVPQVLSMRDPNARGVLRQVSALARFNWFFSTTLAREYARPPRHRNGSGRD